MTPHEAVGTMLIATTAITAITTASRITHGLRPKGSASPCINFYELGGGDRFQGMERQSFSINCRARTPKETRALARLVVDLFDGMNGDGTHGNVNTTFEVSRAYLRSDNGLIPEPEDNLFNAPVDVTMLYPSSTVS